jgi:hypothetical protein
MLAVDYSMRYAYRLTALSPLSLAWHDLVERSQRLSQSQVSAAEPSVV